MISNRYSKANNKYMEDFDKTKPSKYIEYLDANNLYGWAMCENLSIRDFKWMTEEELNSWELFPASWKLILTILKIYPIFTTIIL